MRRGVLLLAVMGTVAIAPPIAGKPIFPYFYGKFPNHETTIRELGYTPTPHLLTTLNSSAVPPYNLAHITNWIRVMKHAGPGYVFVKMDDATNEDVVVRTMRAVADVAVSNGFTVVLYPYFGTAVPTAESALPWIGRIGCGNVGLTLHLPQEIKSGNAQRLPQIITKVKQHIKLVVICGSDLPKEGDQPARWGWDRMIRPLGEGDFDVAAFVRAVRASGYTGCFGQICWGIQRPAQDYLRQSMAYWNSIGEHQHAVGEVACVDGDGNRYATVRIGKQIWMAENLRTTTYNDGTPLPLVTGSNEWVQLAGPAYCFYMNEPSEVKPGYGALYNGYAVTGEGAGGKCIAPVGWRVATEEDWNAMEVHLQNNGYNYDGTIDTDSDPLSNNKIAKALAATAGWAPGTNAGAPGNSDCPEYRTKSGFNLTPSGFRNGKDGQFWGFIGRTNYNYGGNGYYWTGSPVDKGKGIHWRYFNYNGTGVKHVTAGRKFGYAVRCVREDE